MAGEETNGYSRDEQTQAVIAALKAGAKIVEPEGITIILEPLNILVDHPRQLIVHSAHAAVVLKAVGSPNVKMLFDIYHQQISEGNLTRQHSQVSRPDRLLPAGRPSRPPRADDRRDQLSVRAAGPSTTSAIADPIGMEMSPKTDPMTAFKAIRQVDAEARVLERHRLTSTGRRSMRWLSMIAESLDLDARVSVGLQADRTTRATSDPEAVRPRPRVSCSGSSST